MPERPPKMRVEFEPLAMRVYHHDRRTDLGRTVEAVLDGVKRALIAVRAIAAVSVHYAPHSYEIRAGVLDPNGVELETSHQGVELRRAVIDAALDGARAVLEAIARVRVGELEVVHLVRKGPDFRLVSISPPKPDGTVDAVAELADPIDFVEITLDAGENVAMRGDVASGGCAPDDLCKRYPDCRCGYGRSED